MLPRDRRAWEQKPIGVSNRAAVAPLGACGPRGTEPAHPRATRKVDKLGARLVLLHCNSAELRRQACSVSATSTCSVLDYSRAGFWHDACDILLITPRAREVSSAPTPSKALPDSPSRCRCSRRTKAAAGAVGVGRASASRALSPAVRRGSATKAAEPLHPHPGRCLSRSTSDFACTSSSRDCGSRCRCLSSATPRFAARSRSRSSTGWIWWRRIPGGRSRHCSIPCAIEVLKVPARRASPGRSRALRRALPRHPHPRSAVA